MLDGMTRHLAELSTIERNEQIIGNLGRWVEPDALPHNLVEPLIDISLQFISGCDISTYDIWSSASFVMLSILDEYELSIKISSSEAEYLFQTQSMETSKIKYEPHQGPILNLHPNSLGLFLGQPPDVLRFGLSLVIIIPPGEAVCKKSIHSRPDVPGLTAEWWFHTELMVRPGNEGEVVAHP